MGTMMLRDTLASIEQLDEDATIYAAEPWTAASPAVVALEGEQEAMDALRDGMAYLLEVSIAREVIEVWAAWRGGRVPNPEECSEAVIYYAMNDSYLPA